MTNDLSIIANEGIAQIMRLDGVANNIANVDTPGFKAFQLYLADVEPVDEEGNTQPSPGLRSVADYSQGTIQRTGNVLDLAIEGEGFFTIQTERGNAYTRDGRFLVDGEGKLVTLSGDCVLGKSGAISLEGDTIEFSQAGAVIVDGAEVDALNIVNFENPSALSRLGGSLYSDPDNLAGMRVEENPAIQSGCLEASNVQVITEMTRMIDIQRSFELYQKVMQTLQDMDKLSTTRLGKLA
ncbi:MAG: flagellar hook-basal body protein [Syntrophales bacterium]|nr:flagellar hook-basal body protein [Syntrophales bacterium]